LVVIVFLLLFNQFTGIHGVAVCMVIAWFIQLIIQIPWAKKFGYPFKLKLDYKDPNLKKVFLLAVPILISTAVLPVNNLVSTRLASGMETGAVAALEYAYKLYIVISGVFTYAVGNIIFPELSRAASEKEEESFKDIIQKAIRLLTFILIPLTLGIMLYRQDMVSVMYERGEFDATSTAETAGALFYYTIGILGAGLVEVMNKSFYAKQDTKTPLYVGLGVIVTNLVLSIILGNTSMTFRGLALATSITSLLNALVLTVIANRKTKGIVSKDLVQYIGKITIAAVGMILVVLGINYGLEKVLAGSLLKNLIRMVLGAGIGVIFYIALTTLLKVNELKGLFRKKMIEKEFFS